VGSNRGRRYICIEDHAFQALPPRGRHVTRQQLARVVPFLPALVVVIAWACWARLDGAYFPRTWYPSALAALVLLVSVVLAGRRALPAARGARLALLLLGGFVAWAYIAVLWSDSPGDGLASANKLLLYLLVAWLLALLPWTPRSTLVLLGGWVVAVAIVCAWSLVSAVGTDHIGDFFVKERFSYPLGYSNGLAALGAMAFWPALVLSYLRTVPIVLRPLFLALAVFVLEFSLLPQSRGSIIALIVTLPVFVLLAPERLRLIPVGLVVAAAVALSIDPIYEVYDVAAAVIYEGSHQAVGPVLDDAASRIGLVVLLAGIAGVVLAVLDRLARPSEGLVSGTRRVVAVVMIACAVLGAGAAVVNAGTLVDDVDERWETFKSGRDTVPHPGVRLTAVYADQRYDYWRVGLEGFESAPVAGIGTGGYERYYTIERRLEKPSRYAHDLWLRVLSELGIIGFALLVAFLVAALGVAGWRSRSGGRDLAAVCAGAVAASFYFFAHSSFDWIEEFPALAAPAFALPIVALTASVAQGPAAVPLRGRARRIAAGVAGAAGVALAALALVPAYLSVRFDERGERTWTASPDDAFRDLERAADLAPLSPRPQLRAGTLAIDVRRYRLAEKLFRSSIEREDTWYARFELALLASRAGKSREAEHQIRIARTLNREDRFVSEAHTKISQGKRVSPERFEREMLELNRARFTAPRI
jgi:hypothetical protein